MNNISAPLFRPKEAITSKQERKLEAGSLLQSLESGSFTQHKGRLEKGTEWLGKAKAGSICNWAGVQDAHQNRDLLKKGEARSR